MNDLREHHKSLQNPRLMLPCGKIIGFLTLREVEKSALKTVKAKHIKHALKKGEKKTRSDSA